MDSTLATKLKKTAEGVAGRLGEAAQNASERINEMVEMQRLAQKIHVLHCERERCRQIMADLLIRMFDQETFAPALLRPEYQRIKELEAEISRLEKDKELLHRGEVEVPAEIIAPVAMASAEEHGAPEDMPTGEEG